MSGKEFNRPDEGAMCRVLEREKGTMVEVIIRLAWKLGLSPEELRQIKWSNIYSEDQLVEISDRKIPIDDETLRCLKERCHRRGFKSEYVVIGDHSNAQLTRVSIARMLRAALDKEPALTKITLTDLRQDFVIRQLEQHDWTYVAQISGMASSTLSSNYTDYVPSTKKSRLSSEVNAYGIWQVLQREGDSPAGLALHMSWCLGMSVSDIVSLTWDKVDLELNIIRVPGDVIPLDGTLRRRLLRIKANREPEDAPFVVLKPRANSGYSLPEISRLTRAALIRGGVEDLTIRDLSLSAKRATVDNQIYQYIREHDCISRNEAVDLLGDSQVSVSNRLRRMTDEGKLVCVGKKYYLAGVVVPPEEHYEVLQNYLESVGSAYLQELSELLHIQNKQCSVILRRMVKEGKLELKQQRYSLPAASGEAVGV